MDALPLELKSALSQPPQTKIAVAPVGGMNVCEQRVVGLERPDHESPSSLRTMDTPLTILANFRLAAQRAV